jgi:hypothetical protein
MRRAFFAFAAGALLVLTSGRPQASGVSDERFDAARSSQSNTAPSVFHPAEERSAPPSPRFQGSLTYVEARMAVPAGAASYVPNGFSPAVSGGAGGGKRAVVAIAASAILPGLGELYLYFDSKDKGTLARVPAFIALDGYLWYGYFHNHSKGKDIESEFRDYADEHWRLDRFLRQHPCCNQGVGDSCESWQAYNEHCLNEPNYFFYTAREADAQEYYENIGKYNAFVFGWDDAAAWNYDNPNEFEEYKYWTPHRKYYWSLRQESDKYLLRADQRLMMLLVNRVASMLDAGWIAYRMSKGKDPNDGWSLRLKTFDEAPSLVISRRF